MSFDIDTMPEIYQMDTDRIALAKRRQAAVFRGEKPDHWPVILPGKLTEAQKQIPAPNLKEAFDDKGISIPYPHSVEIHKQA